VAGQTAEGMTSAYAGTLDYERFMADLLRAKVKGRSPELRMLRGVKPKPSATSISPVLSYMEQVVTDLVGQHGCRHSIAHIAKLRDLVDSVIQELVQVNQSDERIELTHINSLRQNFICLNTTMVMQDGKLRWEFKDSHATVHELTQQQSGVTTSSSLPDITDGNSVFDKLYSRDAKRSESAGGSDDSREEERKENAYVVKNLRSRLKKSQDATKSAEKRVEDLEDGRIVQGETMAKLKEELRLLKMAHAKLKRKLSESQAEVDLAKTRERAAEIEGRSDAEQELQEKRKAAIKQDQRIQKMLRESTVATTELKVMQGRLSKAEAVVSQAKTAKDQLWVENRRVKGALSDAQGLVRVLQEKGTGHAEVEEYGLRELAEKDRLRGENIDLGDRLKVEQKNSADLESKVGEEKQKVEQLQQSLAAAERRCQELTGQVFHLQCDLENATGKAPEPEPEKEQSQRQQSGLSFNSSPAPNRAARSSGSMAMALGAHASSSSSVEASEGYGSEEDFEEDEEEEVEIGGQPQQQTVERTKPTVDVTLGHMDDDEARDSVRGQNSSKSLPSPISPIKRARENAMMMGGGRRPR
jgi:hypothetical protein